jgi:hypothetical protein
MSGFQEGVPGMKGLRRLAFDLENESASRGHTDHGNGVQMGARRLPWGENYACALHQPGDG